MTTPHLSPSPLSTQLAPPPLPREDPSWGPCIGEGGGGAYALVLGGGGGETMCRGGGGVVCVVLLVSYVQYFYSSLPPLSPHIFPPSVFPVF